MKLYERYRSVRTETCTAGRLLKSIRLSFDRLYSCMRALDDGALLAKTACTPGPGTQIPLHTSFPNMHSFVKEVNRICYQRVYLGTFEVISNE